MSRFHEADATDCIMSSLSSRLSSMRFEPSNSNLKRERETSYSEDDCTIAETSTTAIPSSLDTPIKSRLASLKLHTEPQFASRIPTRSTSNISLNIHDYPTKLPSRLPVHTKTITTNNDNSSLFDNYPHTNQTLTLRKQRQSAIKKSTDIPAQSHIEPSSSTVSSSEGKRYHSESVAIPQNRFISSNFSVNINSSPEKLTTLNATTSSTTLLQESAVTNSSSKQQGRIPSFKSSYSTRTLRSSSLNKELPSYLKPTTSSLNRTKLDGKENLTPHHQSSNRKSQQIHPQKERMKPLDKTMRIRSMDFSSSRTHQLPKQRFASITEQQRPQEQPKLQPVKIRAQKPLDTRNGSNRIKRSISLNPNSINRSMLLKASELKPKAVHKISTNGELYNLITTHEKTAGLFNNFLDSLIYQDEPSLGYNSVDIGTRRPDLYDKLNVYEKSEITRKNEIYFTGRSRELKLKIDVKNFNQNFGFDNSDKNYKCIIGDHINYRYEILSVLGQGSFGSVISVKDYKTAQVVAVKIIKNEMQWSLQAVNEVKFLKTLNSGDEAIPSIMKYIEHFHFRSHICIVTELLPVNLYQLIEATSFKGLNLPLVKQFTKDILIGLNHIHQNGIIHCDLKPENLMLSHSASTDNGPPRFIIKIIDYGSSANVNELGFSYLQSRFYRAPEVCIGARYDTKIDIWSLGSILVELFTGTPLFQVNDEYELINDFINYFGPPSRHYILGLRFELHNKGPIANPTSSTSGGLPIESEINYSTLLWRGFTNDGFINDGYLSSKKPSCKFKPSSKSLRQYLIRYSNEDLSDFRLVNEIDEFVDFLGGCFVWNKAKRLDCESLLRSSFIR